MMKHFSLFILAAFFAFAATSAQEAAKPAFTPSGKATGKVFFNFNHDFTEGATKTDAFEINRVYFGYNYSFSEAISAKVLFDGYKTSPASAYTAVVKNAYLDWKLNSSAVLTMGMMELKQIDTQSKFIGYRYLYKDYADEFGFGTTADLGANLEYTFNPKIKTNIFALNGEGFTSTQDNDGNLKYGANVVYTPNKRLTFTAYGSIYGGQVAGVDAATIQNYDVFAAYKGDKYRIAAGYYTMFNATSYNKVAEGHDLMGFNIFGAYTINSKFEVFAQYMTTQSNTLDGATAAWNEQKDGDVIMGGIQYSPVKGVKTCLNVKTRSSDDEMVKQQTALFMNLEFTF